MPKNKLPEVFNQLEYNVPADKLVEAVRQHLIRTEGETYSPEKVKKICVAVVESRI